MTSIRLPAYKSAIASRLTVNQERLRVGEIKEAFEALFLEPLAKLDPAGLGKLPRYLLVDALDEAATGPLHPTIDALLAQTLDLFPAWLRLVATSRDKPSVLDPFGAATLLRLDRDDPRNQRDVELMITRFLAPAKRSDGVSSAETPSPELGNLIAGKADGNALCAAQLCLAARRSGMEANAVAALPRGLAALYREILQRRFDAKGSQWEILREVLEMLLATRAQFPCALAAAARGDAAQYETRDAIEAISDLLNLENDRMRLFHQSLVDFLAHPGTRFFINPRQGASRLLGFLANESAFAELSPLIRSFCLENLADWELLSDSLQSHAASIPGIYDRLLFSKSGEGLPYYVCGVTVDEKDKLLIARFAAAGLEQIVAETVSLALTRATERFRASGASPWISELGKPPPEESLRTKISREINASFAITCFALGWAKVLGSLSPRMRPHLYQILQSGDAQALNWVIGWLDIAVGYRVLGISGYFEDQAWAIRSDWAEIEKELELGSAG